MVVEVLDEELGPGCDLSGPLEIFFIVTDLGWTVLTRILINPKKNFEVSTKFSPHRFVTMKFHRDGCTTVGSRVYFIEFRE